MWKWLAIPVLLIFTGCTTPDVVYKDLGLIRDNIVIQQKISDILLRNVVPKNGAQIEALAEKTMEIEQRHEQMSSGLNRLIIYFKAEKHVDFIHRVLDFMQISEFDNLLSDAEKEENNESMDEDLLTRGDIVVYSEYDHWVLSPTESD